MSSARTVWPSSVRRRFSRRIFKENGRRAAAGKAFSTAPRRKIVYSVVPTGRIDWLPNEFAMMGVAPADGPWGPNPDSITIFGFERSTGNALRFVPGHRDGFSIVGG